VRDEDHPECIRITEEHLEKFEDEDPIPIYEVPTNQLGYGNRILVKFRELISGSKGDAEYRSLPFPKIRVSRELDEEIKDDVVRHEVNHYLDRASSEPDKYDMRFAAVMLSSLGLILIVPAVSQPAKGVLSLIGSVGLIVYPLYHHLVVEERKANQGTVFEESDRPFKNLVMLPVALLAIPFKFLTSIEDIWMERKRIIDKIRVKIRNTGGEVS